MINLLKNYSFSEYEQMLINKSKLKIQQIIKEKDIENLAISFSGGRDSTVLKHLVESIEPKIISIFSNTGLEYNSIVNFVRSFNNIKEIKPKKSFIEVINKYGYPAISKEQSRYISDIKNPKTCQKIKDIRLGYGNFKISKKWRWILNTDIKLSDRCCYYLKKAPLTHEKKYYFTGERIQESSIRKLKYHTCILPKKCIPLRLWSDKLINKYIYKYNIKICDIYKYERRTGCKFCLYGIHMEKRPNRIDRLGEVEHKFAEKIGIVKLMEKILKGNDKEKIKK